MAYDLSECSATITSGTSQSGAISTGSYVPVAVFVPASWTTANLSIQAASSDGGTYYNLYTGGVQAFVSVVAGAWNQIDATSVNGWTYFKVTSCDTTTTATPVNQGADRVLTFRTRRVLAL